MLQTQAHIQWQDLKDMRNFLAHDYRGVDLDIVFSVVKVELPILSAAFIVFLRQFSKQEVEEVLQSKFYKQLYYVVFKNNKS